MCPRRRRSDVAGTFIPGIALVSSGRRAGAERDGRGVRLAARVGPGEAHLVTGVLADEDVLDVGARGDGLPVEGGYHVALSEARRGRRSSCLGARDLDARRGLAEALPAAALDPYANERRGAEVHG